ncbi:receptor-like protein 6 [Quercus suber]|uniref:Receptor-like protein 6 n=1 Tax=Quercus suber TaxID=58331 RepID=A0AAW0J0Q7_QUESU
MKSLGMLDLSHNELSLLIDETCTNATPPKIYGLDLAACNLIEFPNFLKNQDGLQWLSLAYNNITGHIPEWMWHISRECLSVMDLSFNNLTGFDGQVPFPLPWTNLAILDLSSNQLEGSGSSDESIVGIEPVTGAALIFAMFKQLVDYREANEAANTTTTSRGWGWFGRHVMEVEARESVSYRRLYRKEYTTSYVISNFE